MLLHTIRKYHELIILLFVFLLTLLIRHFAITNSLQARSPTDNIVDNTGIIHTVRTNARYHQSRIEPILLTWFEQAAQQTYFITDTPAGNEIELRIKTNNHLISTKCSKAFVEKNGCKMNKEFDEFVSHEDGKWWCHWEDLNYVNLKLLMELLKSYDWRQPWYVGRAKSFTYQDRTKLFAYKSPLFTYKDKDRLREYADGSCGFCVSRELVTRMKPLVHKGKLHKLSNQLMLDGEKTVGFVIVGLLGVTVTHVDRFNTYESSGRLENKKVKKQISISYWENVHVNLKRPYMTFPLPQDPTRLYSIHCVLYPMTEYCLNMFN